MELNKSSIKPEDGIMGTILSWLVRIDWFHILRFFFPSLLRLPPPADVEAPK